MKCFVFLALFLWKKDGFRFIRFRIEPKLFGEILYRGTPGALVQFEIVLTVASFNQILLKYVGPIGVDSFAIISYIGSLATEMFFGVTDGVQPLLAVSHGKQDRDDIRYYTKGSDSEFYECRIEYDTAIYNDESINRFYDYFDEIAEKLSNITDFSAVRALSIISKQGVY